MRRGVETKDLAKYGDVHVEVFHEGKWVGGPLLTVRKAGRQWEVTFGVKKQWAMMVPTKAVRVTKLTKE